MALDEVLLHSAADGVLLRLYAWAEPTVSFGYFEHSRSARRVALGRNIVRRWTGGGIVEHGDDLTYSLCVPRSCDFANLRSHESYRRIHACLADALQRCGTSSASHVGPEVVPPVPVHANACFERPVLHDLLVAGRKVAGGAQRRNRVGLLHQGSVRIGLVDPAWKNDLWSVLPTVLADRHEERTLTPDEITQAQTLATTKYATTAWTDRF